MNFEEVEDLEDIQCPICSNIFDDYVNFSEHFDECLTEPQPKKQKIFHQSFENQSLIQTISSSTSLQSSIHSNSDVKIPPLKSNIEEKNVEEDEIEEDLSNLDSKDILFLYPCINCKKYSKIEKLFCCSEDCEQKICKICLIMLLGCNNVEDGEFPCKFCGDVINSEDLNFFMRR
eukprot:gene1036-9940_t